MHVYLQVGQIGIFREVFSQEQEKEKTPWYRGYYPCAKEGLLYWEALQPVQEPRGHIYHTQHMWVL